MPDILQEILQHKQTELDAVRRFISGFNPEFIHNLTRARKSFKAALQQPGLSIIAEVKRHSPSKGALADIDDPCELAATYAKGGADAISVLTDRKYFSGCQQDLTNVTGYLNNERQVVLRKDFIIDEVQVIETAIYRANALLLIVAAIPEQLKSLLAYTRRYELDAIVEVHNREELDLALNAEASIIGINNRNLHDFSVNIETSLSLIEQIPSDVIKISESGIQTVQQAKQLFDAGFDAVLMGEALVTHAQPQELIRQIKDACSVSNTIC